MEIDSRLELFNHHRSIRKFKNQALRPGDFEQLIWAAQRAPTDATAQMYSFLRITETNLKKQIATICNNPHMAEAAECLIVLADVNRLKKILELRGHTFGDWPTVAAHFAIGDAVLAGQNLLIAAEMLGYAGCWIGGVLTAIEEIVSLLKLPTGVLPFAGLVIGLADEQPTQRPRIQPELVLHTNQYQEATTAELEESLTRMAAISARGDWAQTLARYFAKGGTMEMRETVLRKVLNNQGFANTKNELDELLRQVNAAGFSEILVRAKGEEFEAWVDKPDRAERGDGTTASAALREAVAAALK